MLQGQEQDLMTAGLGNWQYGQDAPWRFAENFAGLSAPAGAQFGTRYGEDEVQSFQDKLIAMVESGLFNTIEGSIINDEGGLISILQGL